jgi:hypothetical protein
MTDSILILNFLGEIFSYAETIANFYDRWLHRYNKSKGRMRTNTYAY